MNIKLTIIVYLLWICGFAINGQQRLDTKQIKVKGDYIHNPTKTTFPKSLSDFQMESVYSFDKKDLNVGVTYRNQNTTISIYLYPAGNGYEGRLRNEYINSMQSVANITQDGLNATQFPVKSIGEKYICNGFKAIIKSNKNNQSQLTLYECGTWFLKLLITTNEPDTAKITILEKEITDLFDPTRLTSLHPLNPKADVYFSKTAFRDSILIGSAMGSVYKKIEWASENVTDAERASGFPDLYLNMQIEALKAFLKFQETHDYTQSEFTKQYLKELNLINNSGFLTEFIMEQFGMILIVPENTYADFDKFDEWKQTNKITISLKENFYTVSYGQKE